jgi:hypothetical protein
MRQLLCLSLILAIISLCGGCNQAARPTKWEHRIVVRQIAGGFDSDGWRNELNKAGDDGWELVCVTNYKDESQPPLISLIAAFKKPKS